VRLPPVVDNAKVKGRENEDAGEGEGEEEKDLLVLPR
jgi:hypothetical protein